MFTTGTLEESIRRGRSEDPGSRDTMAILRGLNLLVGDGQLSRAAVILFCQDDIQYPDFPQLKLRLARFKGTTRNEFLDNKQYSGNAFSLMRRAERFLLDGLPIAGRIVPGQLERIDTPALPIEAIREALANAFIHRDYTSGSGSIGVALYDDRLEIISPGNLHFGLTPEALFQAHESRPWNPLIASIFYGRGHIETWGRGTLKIVELMTSAGLTAPTIHNTLDDHVIVTFDLTKLRGRANEGVNEGVNPALLEAIDTQPGLRTPALAKALKTSSKNVERWLKIMRDAKKIEFRGASKTGGYYVCTQVI